MAYRVKAVTAVIKIGGSERYLHRGAIVPSAATNAEHLAAVGLLEEFEQPAAAEVPEADSAEDEQAAAEKAEADKAAADKAEAEKPAGRSSSAKK